MAVSDAILARLLELHPKIIDLSLERMHRLAAALGHPERRLPPVVHIAGTNGKGSIAAYLRAVMERAGLTTHVYTSPHLVRFHERIRLGRPGGGELIAEEELTALLEECERANGGEPITFFEITTAAAFLAFARRPADYLVLETGLGGRLDATNIVARPRLSVISAIDYDHQQYLGSTLTAIAGEKAGILKTGVPGVVAPQREEALAALKAAAGRVGAPLHVAYEDWQAFEQHGRLVYQDETALLDLPLPALPGRFQVDNAGAAVAAVRLLADGRITDSHIAEGLRTVEWPARLQRLGEGALTRLLPEGTELWLDGGHNPSAGRAVANAMADLNDRNPRPLVLVVGMLNSKAADGYLAPFAGLAQRVVTLAIPGEENAIPAAELARIAAGVGLQTATAAGIEEAVVLAGRVAPSARVLIGGSLYLAGRVLALDRGQTAGTVTGTSRLNR
jgi:dihydrofolate synthase/folylpolyglutamate synthase